MPEPEGLQTIREPRRGSPDSRIIAVSGGGSERILNFLTAAKILGAQRTRCKPFNLDELRQTRRDVLKVSSTAAMQLCSHHSSASDWPQS
jgi:DNA-binding response OmpR family regulator